MSTNTKYIHACGKRKTSIAQIKLFPNGTGNITINNKDLNEYCPDQTGKDLIRSPLKVTNINNTLNFTIKVCGGGKNAQIEAVRHGISRALVKYNQLNRPILKRLKFLTRDSRIKERKKYGLKRARRAPQFSKR